VACPLLNYYTLCVISEWSCSINIRTNVIAYYFITVGIRALDHYSSHPIVTDDIFLTNASPSDYIPLCTVPDLDPLIVITQLGQISTKLSPNATTIR
jgi:hypothetical protein